MSDSFVHLHVHSESSLLDGAARIEAMFARAAEYQMPALALTDHGAMFGALQSSSYLRLELLMLEYDNHMASPHCWRPSSGRS